MESVWTAAKNFFRKLFDRSGKKLQNWSLRLLRSLIWRADEWCWRQEQALKLEPAGKTRLDPEFDREASALRERAIVKLRKPRRRAMTAAEFDARFAGVRQ